MILLKLKLFFLVLLWLLAGCGGAGSSGSAGAQLSTSEDLDRSVGGDVDAETGFFLTGRFALHLEPRATIAAAGDAEAGDSNVARYHSGERDGKRRARAFPPPVPVT